MSDGPSTRKGPTDSKMEAVKDSSVFAVTPGQRQDAINMRRAIVGDSEASKPENELPFEHLRRAQHSDHNN